MKTNAAGFSIIKGFESFFSKAYYCPAGVLTIYWGHVCRSGEVYDGTREQGEWYLHDDIASSEAAVSRLIHVPLNENQFSALVSFTFNLGSGALQASTLRAKLNRGEYLSASDEFGRWVLARGLRLLGLVARREVERKLFLAEVS
jgi:lysozyme